MKKKGSNSAYENKDIESEAITLVRNEKQNWETATAFITDRVSFRMRSLIRTLRKNYYGVFDMPKDEYTGLEKVWYPLTEINVEAVVKNIDLDQKDVNFRSKTPNGYGITDLTRSAVREKLSSIFFGQKLDDMERNLAIDGTAVWKTYEVDGKLIVQPVDLLNIYIDPTTPSIQEAYRFTERSLMFPEEIQQMKGWINTEDIDENVTAGLPRTDPYYRTQSAGAFSNVKMVDVWEMWGKMPLSLITGKREDSDKEVEGHIVVSGIDSPGKERCHLIEKNTKKDSENNFLKPYEECWYTRVPNRWYGRGIAEKLLTLQVYANIVFNVRINRSRISQLGIFKIRKNSGITPQMLSRLPSNGAVVLNDMNDLEQLVMQEVGATSYKDEDVINSISERLTNAFEVATGEGLPSSTSATASVLQSTSANSGFSLIKDGIGGFLERWMDRHALPIIANEMTIGDIVRFTADDDTFKELVDRIVTHKAAEALDDVYSKGFIPSDMELQAAIDEAREKMLKSDLFVDLVQNIIASQLETQVFVTNEQMDVGVTVQNLISLIPAAPEYKDAIVKQTFDLLGLPEPKAPKPQVMPGQGIPQMIAQGLGQEAPTAPAALAPQQAQQQYTAALTR